jgi:hypothetical protein
VLDDGMQQLAEGAEKRLKEAEKNIHGKANHSTGGLKRAQLPYAVHHRYRSVRHLRVSHQPEQ